MLTDFLPTTRKECELRGWDELDVILFSGDAYVDHPSFGAAVIGRVLEAEGYRVAIVPQPDWHGDYRDFKKLGRPRLFFGIAPGCMDSMVNKYTANKRLRSEDAYSPDGRHDCRPEYPTIVYTRILKQLFPDVPVVLGGIEASMRRLTHYDYWQDRLRPSILVDSGADIIIYGMGEKPIAEIARRLAHGEDLSDVPQIAYLQRLTPDSLTSNPSRKERGVYTSTNGKANDKSNHSPLLARGVGGEAVGGGASLLLHSHEECLRSKRAQAENIRLVEIESNKMHPQRIVQPLGLTSNPSCVVVNPPYPPLTTEELDAVYELPYTRLPHPKYRGKRIPAYDMIKHSVTIHRGCFGGCAFCTISMHQGKFVTPRSKESILREVKVIAQQPDFKGYLSDLGGPSANMYAMQGRNLKACEKCSRHSCIHPKVCPNLNNDHRPLLDLYHAVDSLPGIKKSLVSSGVRYDLLLHQTGNPDTDQATRQYTRELIARHVGGRLKVAPEHTADQVLHFMRKPSFQLFHDFKQLFDRICREEKLNYQLIPYFISSHPGCTLADMAALAAETKQLNFHLEQVQDFTPTPMTISTEAYYTGLDPLTLEPLYTAKTQQQKLAQRQFFFWYQPQQRAAIERTLRQIGRPDLIRRLYGGNPAPAASKPGNRHQQQGQPRNTGKKKRKGNRHT